MNITLMFLSSIMQEAVEAKDLRTSKQTIVTEVIMNHPLMNVEMPGCPFCKLDRCRPLDFCYVIKNSLHGSTSHEYCASSQDLSSVVRDRLANFLTDNACQPSVMDLDTAYCWCQNSSSRDTVEDQLRRLRIWRYQPLKWHADRQMNSSGFSKNFTSFILCLSVYFLFW